VGSSQDGISQSARGQSVRPQDLPDRLVALKVIAFLTDYAVVDRIIEHLNLSFIAERPPPPHIAYQEVLLAAEAPAEYFS
jgi:hypothetical protein